MEKKKPCKSCKKPKEVSELPSMDEIMKTMSLYSDDEIKLAYAELSSYGGVKEDKKQFIKDVYQYLFMEEFDFNCSSCVSRQARKFHNFITNKLKLKV